MRLDFRKFILCFGRESNPYGHFCPRDFKSRVSTYSTTKAAVPHIFQMRNCKGSKYICKKAKEILN